MPQGSFEVKNKIAVRVSCTGQVVGGGWRCKDVFGGGHAHSFFPYNQKKLREFLDATLKPALPVDRGEVMPVERALGEEAELMDGRMPLAGTYGHAKEAGYKYLALESRKCAFR